MASRIKGITVEIGGDTTKLEQSLKSVNSTIKSTQSQLKDVTKLLKLDPKNTELLSQKQRLLKDAINERDDYPDVWARTYTESQNKIISHRVPASFSELPLMFVTRNPRT